jgi:hypothetical protein
MLTTDEEKSYDVLPSKPGVKNKANLPGAGEWCRLRRAVRNAAPGVDFGKVSTYTESSEGMWRWGREPRIIARLRSYAV